MTLPSPLRTVLGIIPLLAGSLAADESPWYPIPFQESHHARSLFCHRDRVWVGDDGGLHESRDGGESWRTVEPLSGKGAYAVYAADSFLVVLRYDGIHRSTDAGRTWLRAEGERPLFSETGNHFRARNDSLILESYGTALGDRMVSLDQGRSWVSLGNSPSPVSNDSVEPFPGQSLMLADGILSQSRDSGKTWNRLPWQAPLGQPLALAAGSGNAYMLSSGLILRRRGSLETWDILASSPHPVVVRQLAASGNNLCASTSFAVSCSRDGGRNFRMMGRNPFPIPPSGWAPKRPYLNYDFNIAVDQDRIYLSSIDQFGPNFLWTRSLADSGAWSRLRFSPKDTVKNLTAAAKDGLLVLFEEGETFMAHVSTDQGRTFREIPIGTSASIRIAALSRTRWALVAESGLLLSSDSGKTWEKNLSYRGPNFPSRLSLTDSAMYTGGYNRFAFQDSTWSVIPGPELVLAASDSATYAVSGETLWAKRLLPEPTVVPGRRAQSRRHGPRDRQIRDILGKISRRPAPSYHPKRPVF